MDMMFGYVQPLFLITTAFVCIGEITFYLASPSSKGQDIIYIVRLRLAENKDTPLYLDRRTSIRRETLGKNERMNNITSLLLHIYVHDQN